ncbi:MAG: sugar kinase [Chloroflexota bacterium]|nr:sugar kinase [Chloroflexota bacterium]
MIFSTAPTRISLGGGGTDLASYYSRHGGFLIAGAINKYCTVVANKRFYQSIRVCYHRETEIVDDISQIRHRIFREALELCGNGSQLELVSIADVPANSGLGASSSFTVALLNALHAYRREPITKERLAEEACYLEIEVLGQPIGKQDQYIAAFGGLTCLTFGQDGTVIVEPLRVSDEVVDRLESNLLLFFTGIEREASEILVEQDERSKGDDLEMMENLHQIKEIGLETRRYLERGDVDMLGELFHAHWESKKRRSAKMTDPFIDECYQVARGNGALGGKLIGAGGGGFLLFYSHNSDRSRLIQAMQGMGLRWERFHFDFDGAKIAAHIR